MSTRPPFSLFIRGLTALSIITLAPTPAHTEGPATGSETSPPVLQVQKPKLAVPNGNSKPKILRGSASVQNSIDLRPKPKLTGDAGMQAPKATPTPKLLGETGTWHMPDIHTLIAQSGESIVSEQVIDVQAFCACTSRVPGQGRTTANPWTPSNITIKPGQKLWIDTNEAVKWNWTTHGSCDSTGIGFNCARVSCLFSSPLIPQSTCSLVAYVGNNQPPGSVPGQIVWNATCYTDPAAFAVGSFKKDYSPKSAGRLYFIPNDNALGDNSGYIPVRVIVTKPR